MSQTTLIIVIAIIAVAVVAAIAALLTYNRSRQRKQVEADRVAASQLRTEATADTRHVDEARLEADEARNRAERSRLEAERAEADALEADRKKAMEEAGIEDQVRTADRLDPDLDHEADDYTPSHARPDETPTPTDPTATPTSTRTSDRS